MRKQWLGVMMVMLGLGIGSSQAAMVLDWSDDFSSDPVPPWIQVGSSIQWSSPGENVSWHNFYNTSDSFSRPASVTLNQGSDFQVSLDYMPAYTWYAPQQLGGLVNSTGNGQAIFRVVPQWVEYPTLFDVTGLLYDSDGGMYETSAVTISQYAFYRITLTYTGMDRNLNLSVMSGETIVGSVNVELPEGKTFSVDQFKLYNQVGGGGDSYAWVDNVGLSIPEPATMSLLAVGVVAFLRRRRRS